MIFSARQGLGLLAVACLITSPLLANGGVSSYCTSGNQGARISATGSADFTANGGAGDLVLRASGLPAGTLGLFFYGSDAQSPLPLGNGFLCVGGGASQWRLGTVAAGQGQTEVAWNLDYNSPPDALAQITPGSTWNFQFWFRDGASSDLTDAIEIQFVPPSALEPVVTVADFSRSSHPLAQTFEGGALLLNTDAEYQAFWQAHTASFIPPPPAPVVDMNQVSLVAVFAGRRLSSGFDVAVDQVLLSVTTVEVDYTERQPGQGCGVNFSETSPMELVAVRKVDGGHLGRATKQIFVYSCP